MTNKSRPAQVCDVMSHNVIQVNDHDSVEFVINLFDRCHISGAPVVNDEGDYVGVVTRTDLSGRKILDWVNNDCHLDSMLIKEIMSFPELITLPTSAKVTEAIHLMLNQKIHRVFITDEDKKIVGVISSFDVMKVIEVNASDLNTAPKKPNPIKPTKSTLPPQKGSLASEEASTEDENEDSGSSKRLDELEQRIQELIIRKQQDFQTMAAERSSTATDN